MFDEPDEERKKKMEETWKNVSVPGYLKAVEKLLVARGGKHFAGNEVPSKLHQLKSYISAAASGLRAIFGSLGSSMWSANTIRYKSKESALWSIFNFQPSCI